MLWIIMTTTMNKKKIIISSLILLFCPFCLLAQEQLITDSIDDNVSTLLRQLREKQQEIDVLNDSIKKLNEQANIIEKRSSKVSQDKDLQITKHQEKISQLISENQRLKDEIQEKKDSLKIFATLDNIVYKECLLFPLERRYNATYIKEAKQCLAAMGIETTHSKEYETYYHFLDEYESFNNLVIAFLQDQEKRLSMKQWKINELAKSQAEESLKKLPYYKYYINRNKSPWESILYIDETLEEFFKQLNSGKLNAITMQQLIKRLEPKQ